jgi:hypothetical protein
MSTFKTAFFQSYFYLPLSEMFFWPNNDFGGKKDEKETSK